MINLFNPSKPKVICSLKTYEAVFITQSLTDPNLLFLTETSGIKIISLKNHLFSIKQYLSQPIFDQIGFLETDFLNSITRSINSTIMFVSREKYSSINSVDVSDSRNPKVISTLLTNFTQSITHAFNASILFVAEN